MDDKIRDALEKRLIDRDELWKLFVDHYWDSVAKDRDIILSHIDAVMIVLKDQDPWQPIETAPKDKSLILVWSKKLEHAGFEAITVASYESGEWRGKVGGFQIYQDSDLDDNQLTHWMPLPKPPKEGK